MANLGIPRNTIEVLQRHNFIFQKKYGQNFLIDPNVLERVIDAARVTEEDCVLEIGPGIGTMTQLLAERAGKVIAVEIDRNLIPILEETLSPYSNVTLINEDILKLDIRELVQGQQGRPVKVVANLPYYITTPIVMGLLEGGAPLKSITVMVQKEVADRMQAGPGTKEYGALSLAVQYYAEPEVVANVPPNCFIPRPSVGSAVIRLTKHKTPPVRCHEKKMFAIIRASFNQRRKTLANSLGNAAGLGVSRDRVVEALEEMGLPAMVRGEALTLEQFAELSNRL
nr:16S rRNA (adenine(1518)-N(6)/adenine(1519)-N(6))-dimethyltransferase RsmA [uncultured Acetatifactor sp.]